MDALIIRNIELQFTSGSSDKVYHIMVLRNKNNTYSVEFAYGRRNTNLKHGYKVQNVSKEKAEYTAQSLMEQKKNKGYWITCDERDPFDQKVSYYHGVLSHLHELLNITDQKYEKLKDLLFSGHRESQILAIETIKAIDHGELAA